MADTLTAGGPPSPEVSAWLRERSAAAVLGEFVATFTGVLATRVR